MVQSTNFGTAQNNLENIRQDRKMMQEFSDQSEINILENQFNRIDIPMSSDGKERNNLININKDKKDNGGSNTSKIDNITAKHKNVSDLNIDLNMDEFMCKNDDIGDDLLDMMDN